MDEEKSFSEICQDLIALVKTFQEAYKLNTQDEQGQLTDGTQQQMDKRETFKEREQIQRKQHESTKEEQRDKSDGSLGNQQMSNCMDLNEDFFGVKDKKEKVRPENGNRLGKQMKQRINGWKVGNDMVEGAKNLKRKRKRRERGREGSYKVRAKKGKKKKRSYFKGWSNKENG